MADRDAVVSEIDRLVTEGHQDASLMLAIQKKFPSVTQAEFEEAVHEAIAVRKARVERMQQEHAERTDEVPEE